tara:strand:+ start:399 stop:581 length:183 start_codon:yes stop_codon:yes gene_type:complete
MGTTGNMDMSEKLKSIGMGGDARKRRAKQKMPKIEAAKKDLLGKSGGTLLTAKMLKKLGI